jgi:alpha-beta hydrolase superfamily lysophospholipase
MVAGADLLLSQADAIQVPLLMLLGEQDSLIDPGASQELFERVGSEDKTLRIYAQMRHELLNELGREQVLTDLAGWLTHRIDRDAPASQ